MSQLRMSKGGNFEKPPRVPSKLIGGGGKVPNPRVAGPVGDGTFMFGLRWRTSNTLSTRQFISSHPDEPIRSLEAAAKVIRRHGGDHSDRSAESLLRRIEQASTTEEADAAGQAFRAWAQAEGLLLVPPEDSERA